MLKINEEVICKLLILLSAQYEEVNRMVLNKEEINVLTIPKVQGTSLLNLITKLSYLEKDIKISGWVKTVRDSKTFGFIEINDGSFFKNVQIVFNDSLSNFEDIRKLTIASSIIVEGKLVKTYNAIQPF